MARSANQLRVEIRNLDYSVNSGFWAGKLNVEFLLRESVSRAIRDRTSRCTAANTGRTSRSFRAKLQNTQFVNSGRVGCDQFRLLRDQTMMGCLAQ